MSGNSEARTPSPAPELSRRASIIGIGESDYHADYTAERARVPGYEPPTVEDLIAKAFDRALADSGLRREDIDGVSVSYTYGGPSPVDTARLLGIPEPRYAIANGNIMAGPLPVVCSDIAAGKADVVAMVYCVASRAIGREYGGATYSGDQGGLTPPSYYYYHPWGWSSQAAHWAMIFSHYQATFGVTEADLGAVAQQVRRHAARNPAAVMQKPFTIEEYLASRYIVRPLHLYDICLVNDGAVVLIVSRSELAKGTAKLPVQVAGWSEVRVQHSKLHALVRERLRPQIEQAGRIALAMAGIPIDEIGHFEGYDASSIHLVSQVEGFGFAKPGEGVALFQAGEADIGGRIPTNTGGGNLSGSYMHGWSQIAEVVRQLRHEAGARQVPGLRASLSCLAQTDQVHPLVFLRGE